MSICQICQNIPFHKLPVTRKETWPHQPTLAALETSSTECPLCRLIWLGYQQALRQRPVCYDQQYKDGLLRDRELPRTQVRVRGRKDQIGLIHFHVDEIGINIAIGSYKGTVTARFSGRCQLSEASCLIRRGIGGQIHSPAGAHGPCFGVRPPSRFPVSGELQCKPCAVFFTCSHQSQSQWDAFAYPRP